MNYVHGLQNDLRSTFHEWKRNDLNLEYSYRWADDSEMLVDITRPEDKEEAQAKDKKKKNRILKYSYSWEGDSEMMVNITKSRDKKDVESDSNSSGSSSSSA